MMEIIVSAEVGQKVTSCCFIKFIYIEVLLLLLVKLYYYSSHHISWHKFACTAIGGRCCHVLTDIFIYITLEATLSIKDYYNDCVLRL